MADTWFRRNHHHKRICIVPRKSQPHNVRIPYGLLRWLCLRNDAEQITYKTHRPRRNRKHRRKNPQPQKVPQLLRQRNFCVRVPIQQLCIILQGPFVCANLLLLSLDFLLYYNSNHLRNLQRQIPWNPYPYFNPKPFNDFPYRTLLANTLVKPCRPPKMRKFP